MTTSTTRTTEIERLAHYLRRCTKTGIYNYADAFERGVPIAFDGPGAPTARIALNEAERRIAAIANDDLRARVQLRLGLGAFRLWSMTDRYAELARRADQTPESERGLRYRSPAPARSATDALSRAAAAALLDGSWLAPASEYDSTRLLYSRSIVLPAGNLGEVEEIHRRIIRAEVNGLDRILIHQTEHWNSTVTASARGMGGVKIRPLRVREDEHNGIRGERLDIEITFPAMRAGETRELQWTRRRQLEPGWLSDSRSMVFASAPDHPTERMVIEVQFGEDFLPTVVMRFSDVYQGDRLDPDIKMRVANKSGGAVRCEWQHPQVGLASGIRVWW